MRTIVLSSILFLHIACYGHGHDECVPWSDERSHHADIHIETAGPGTIYTRIHVPGKITFHPDHMAYVIPKIGGVIYAVSKNVGDYVEKGETLATIESKQVANLKAEYLSACKCYKIKQILLKKEAALKGISAEQDYLNAELLSEEAAAQLEFALQNLYALGFNACEISNIANENSNSLRFYDIKAPMCGRIVQRDLTLGDLVDDTTRAFTVANFQKVWIEINVNQNDVHFLKVGLPIEIMADGKKETVVLCHYNPTISEETRMATAIATLDNPSEKWTPGEFISVLIQTESYSSPLVVSKDAVQRIKGDNYVFIEEADHFMPHRVRLGKMDDRYVEILSGIEVGERYAACNAFCLKAELEKEEGEHHH